MPRIYIFFGNPATRSWTLCAGLLTGPGIPFLGILLWPFPAPGAAKLVTVGIKMGEIYMFWWCLKSKLVGDFKRFFIFTPIWGRFPI